MVHVRQHAPHYIRSAKPVGGKWSQLPYKQKGKQVKQARREAEDDHRKE